MPMNDGIPFLEDYGTIVEAPRGKDNPHHRVNDQQPYEEPKDD